MYNEFIMDWRCSKTNFQRLSTMWLDRHTTTASAIEEGKNHRGRTRTLEEAS